jgi:hypothetical protein
MPCCVLPGGDDGDRRIRPGAAECHSDTVPDDPDQVVEIRLPELFHYRGAGASTGAADRRRHPDRGIGRRGAVVRNILSSGADDGREGRGPRSIDAVVLDGRIWPFRLRRRWNGQMRVRGAEVAPVVARPCAMLLA